MSLSLLFHNIFVILTPLHFSNAERRIISGEEVKTEKTYMVYLVQAKSSIRNYDSWICGGAIIHRWLVLTSAACVEDVQNVYAIAGYNKYVKLSDLDKDECTKSWRRKVVFTCVPIAYDLQYDRVEKWSYVDIAVVKVEKPFLLDSENSWKECNYRPSAIPINFDPKYEQPGINAIVLGWGHKTKWRATSVIADYNQEKLRYAPVSILSLDECKESFVQPDMRQAIENDMICTFHPGKIDDAGLPIAYRKNYPKDISNSTKPMNNSEDIYKYGENARRHVHSQHFQTIDEYEKFVDSKAKANPTKTQATTIGFCQNDHGGPLVTLIEKVEHVIGVASVFRIDSEKNCIGPFLYTSTTKSRVFIECILNELIQTYDVRRTSICDRPASEKGFEILRRYMSWSDDNIDSLSQNFNVQIRPQIPMSHYRGG